MPQIDVPIYTDPAAWATAAAAHEQAEAAIRAAEIAAQVAWDAALLQVVVGAPVALAAAGAAIYAARLTYRSAITAANAAAEAAIKAAEHQVKLENEKHEAKVNAYAIRQINVIDALIYDAANKRGFTSHCLKMTLPDEFEPNNFKKRIFSISLKYTVTDWNDDKWEEHALLGNKFVKNLIDVRDTIRGLPHIAADFERMLQGHYNDNTILANDINGLVKYQISCLSKFEMDLEYLKNAIPDRFYKL